MLLIILGLAVLAGSIPATTTVRASPDGSATPAVRHACTPAQKKARQTALTSYRKRMPKERAAYFRTRKGAKQRSAFVKKQQARLKALQKALAACSTPTAPATPSAPKSYSFFPQAGILWQDLYVNKFVDLDRSSGVQDWSCNAQSYDGHNGHDSDLRSFREQEIGVPVFAALDGRVTFVRDGEPDTNTARTDAPANAVTLDHGGTHETFYLHLKRGSVAVQIGQAVPAGTQLGLTGSSGSSTWPHLHFESRFRGVPYEPSAGPCRPGASNWTSQPPIRRDLYVRDFAFSPDPFEGRADLPWDEAVRTGAFPAGVNFARFRVVSVTCRQARATACASSDRTVASPSTSRRLSTSRPSNARGGYAGTTDRTSIKSGGGS